MAPKGSSSHWKPLPDYEGLIHLLRYLRRPVDGLGETVLSRSEAAKVRACGIEARAACTWRCPLLPDVLVRDNPGFEYLSDKADPFWRRRGWNPQRAQQLPRYEPSPLGAIEEKILLVLSRAPSHRMAKRRLQQLLWRLPASILNYVLRSLSQQGYLQWHNGWLSSFGTSR